MLPATANRRLTALSEISQQGKRMNGLFRLLENPDLWQQAYANIYANKGATTRGVDTVTMDGFSMERVANTMELLKEGRYRFKPVRRAYIPKANGKRRPLGIPSGDDKLVQEVVRIILEQIYEPIFSDRSHGFRPRRSCHTAFNEIERWNGVKWLVDVDIQGFFDNIDHDLMVKFLEKKIDDQRFINLIRAMLKAGYCEDWKFHRTYSGTPQGGIVSPILANIYLHELDMFMEELRATFSKGRRRQANQEYMYHNQRIQKLRGKISRMQQQGLSNSPSIRQIEEQIREHDRIRKAMPSVQTQDVSFRRLHYCRYADDFISGIIGSKADATAIMAQVKEFINKHLHLNVAEEKSKVEHAKEGTRFLGYEILTVSSDKLVRVKRGRIHTLCRSVAERIRLRVPEDKLRKFCTKNEYGNYETLEAAHRRALAQRSDTEIILTYNAELRGVANFYALAYSARSRLNRLYYVWRTSLFKTLANKHRTTVPKVARSLRQGHDYVHWYAVKGQRKALKVYHPRDLKKPNVCHAELDKTPDTWQYSMCGTEVVKRLNADTCEFCGVNKGYFEVHHERGLKDLNKDKALWRKIMAAMQRKTLVLCIECHDLLHSGRLPDWRRHSKIEGESRMS